MNYPMKAKLQVISNSISTAENKLKEKTFNLLGLNENQFSIDSVSVNEADNEIYFEFEITYLSNSLDDLIKQQINESLKQQQVPSTSTAPPISIANNPGLMRMFREFQERESVIEEIESQGLQEDG